MQRLGELSWNGTSTDCHAHLSDSERFTRHLVGMLAELGREAGRGRVGGSITWQIARS
jgi:hypothetical protein